MTELSEMVISRFFEDVKKGEVVIEGADMPALCADLNTETPLLKAFLKWIIEKDFLR